jgi:hypothetical protein
MLSIPQHGVFKDLSGCCHGQPSLVPKVICIHDEKIVEQFAEHVLRITLFVLNMSWHYLVPTLSSLAVCAKTLSFQGLT